MKLAKAAKFVSMAIVTVVIAAFAMNAGAYTNDVRAQAIANNANTRIELCVKTAQAVGNVLLAAGFDSDSAPVQQLISNVQQQTSQIESQAQSQLDKIGASYQSEYYYVVIAGNQVLIDPFKVI